VTKVIPSLDYEERLKTAELYKTAEHYRRLRGDMIMAYQILQGNIHVPEDFLPLHPPDDRTRGHCMKLMKLRANKNVRLQFFACRSVNSWNSLPGSVVTAPTVNALKSRLDRHWRDRHFYERTTVPTSRPVRL